MEILGNYQCGF